MRRVRYLRTRMGKTMRDRTRNSQIRGIINQEPVTKIVDSRELRWFWHLIMMDSNSKLRQEWKNKSWGDARKGRPRTEWELTRKKGKTLQEATKLAKDKKALPNWRMQPDAWKGNKGLEEEEGRRRRRRRKRRRGRGKRHAVDSVREASVLGNSLHKIKATLTTEAHD